MKNILNRVFRGEILSNEDIEVIVSKIADETINPEQVAAIIGSILARTYERDGIKYHGAAPEEMASFAKCLREYSTPVVIDGKSGFIDVCGTGGDCLGTFNISTTVSFVIASLGVSVAKHGNRSVSSKCGSADVLEKLGIKIDLPIERLKEVYAATNMMFLFAPKFNTCMAKIKKIRNAIAAPTIFNLLGPLINPVKLDYQLVGVYDRSKCELVANAIAKMGMKEAMVIHGNDNGKEGLDELSLTGEQDNIIYHVKEGKVSRFELPSFAELGIAKAAMTDLKGGDAEENAKIILDILSAKENVKGAKRDIVLLNSAAALVVTGKAKDFKEGVDLARKAIDGGEAFKVLEKLRDVSK